MVNRRFPRSPMMEPRGPLGPRHMGERGEPRRKPAPPEQTSAESFYYVKQMQARTPMVVVLTDGQTLRGVIEWYDKNCIKLTRSGEPNLLLYKWSIKYLYKEGEGQGQPEERETDAQPSF